MRERAEENEEEERWGRRGERERGGEKEEARRRKGGTVIDSFATPFRSTTTVVSVLTDLLVHAGVARAFQLLLEDAGKGDQAKAD